MNFDFIVDITELMASMDTEFASMQGIVFTRTGLPGSYRAAGLYAANIFGCLTELLGF